MKNKTLIALGLLPLCIVACDKKENNTEKSSRQTLRFPSE